MERRPRETLRMDLYNLNGLLFFLAIVIVANVFRRTIFGTATDLKEKKT